MLTFKEFLLEDKQGKNLHLEHLEDEIINFGVGGARGAINFLQELRNMLAGTASGGVNMTVKWDGAPAIFAGVDPSDGKFFVAKKSVFNVNPKLYKSNAEIDADVSGGLNSKFKVALKEFSKLGIKNVLQGDLMFTSEDLKKEKIDGETYISFQPNTIVYATLPSSDLGKRISQAKIGVVWHTTYEGDTLQGMKASFGANIKVRQGETIKNVKQHAKGYIDHIEMHFEKLKQKVKTQGAKDKFDRNKKEYIREFTKHLKNLENIILFQNSLVSAKMMIVNKLNEVKQLANTFIKTNKGFKAVNPEGYVAIDKAGNAVKLVDRMEFSYNNFTARKAWDK